jgi:hypothetical protein
VKAGPAGEKSLSLLILKGLLSGFYHTYRIDAKDNIGLSEDKDRAVCLPPCSGYSRFYT